MRRSRPGERRRTLTPLRSTIVVTSILFVALATVGGCGPVGRARGSSDTPALPGRAVVKHHVDGDTIDVLIDGREERVRLTGIDTPEVAHESSANRPGNPAECFGDAAAAHIVALLPLGTELRLVRDVVGRDDYGRLLAYIFRLSDDLFVNEALVRDGFAQPLTIAPNTAYANTFVSAAQAAEADDIGLWSGCAVAPPGLGLGMFEGSSQLARQPPMSTPKTIWLSGDPARARCGARSPRLLTGVPTRQLGSVTDRGFAR